MLISAAEGFALDLRTASLLLIALILLFAGLMIKGMILRFLIHHRLCAENYLKERIPVGLGLILWIICIGYVGLCVLWGTMGLPVYQHWEAAAQLEYALLLSFIFFAGWLDDTIGDRSIKGFTGHIRAWTDRGIVTTGLVKAGITSFASFWAVLRLGQGWGFGLIQFLLIVLMTNAMNLFDLRPGRAIKFFWVLCTLLIIMGSVLEVVPRLLPLWIGSIIVISDDLRAKAMLGDMGANLLGFALGYTAASALPIWQQSLLLAVLVLVHWTAERSSISRIIERNRALSWLDGLGRPR